MVDVTVIRGDSYSAIRPLWTFQVTDRDGLAFDVGGCTIRTSFKPRSMVARNLATDDDAVVRHELELDSGGEPVSAAGLGLNGPSRDGLIDEYLSAAETSIMPIGIALVTDIEITTPDGDTITTLFLSDTVTVVNAVTNRTT